MNDIQLFHGDCLELFSGLENESVDLVVVDPPYKMTKRGKSCRPNWMADNMGENVFDGDVPDSLKWMEECFRVLRNGTHLYTFCNTNDLQTYLNNAEKVGFKFHNLISMIKDTRMPNRWYLKQTELLLFFRKGPAKPINDMTSIDNINVTMPKKSNGKLHITQKPLDFIEKLVSNSTKPGEVVLDCFMGSGTTGVACKNLGRKFIRIEKDEDYFKIAKERIEKT